MNLKESFQEIKNIVLSELPDSKIYLYGESLRFLLENKKPTELKIFIETKKSENIILVSQYLLKFKNLSPSFGKKLKLENEFLTVNCIYLNIDDVLSGNISTGCFYGGLKDNSKKIIKLTPFGKEELQKNPKIIFDLLLFNDLTGFHFDPNTVTFIIKNVSLLNSLEKREIFMFLKKILLGNKPRKIVSNLNTFGISKELFGVNLTETCFINHLKSNDFYEMTSLIFDNIEPSEIESFLLRQCGFLLRDVSQVVTIMNIIHDIKDESKETAIEILSKIDKHRVVNIRRLIRVMGYKTLSKNIFLVKNSVIQKELCITEKIISYALGISNSDKVKSLFEKAKMKIEEDCNYNDLNKIIAYLRSSDKEHVI
jgi:tRNA nucleotidyltransferase/poly(A) polymerase